MGNVFAQKPLKEIVRENQRMLKKSIRELEKEIKTLETNEKKLIADIKKHAKLNQMVRNYNMALVRSSKLICFVYLFYRALSKLWQRIWCGHETI